MKTLVLILIILAIMVSGFGSYINFCTGDNVGGIMCFLLVITNILNLWTQY